MSAIKIEHLTKDYGSNKGVFDISFEVKKGEVFGFLGPNGAGKTTTIRNLMGFIKADNGTCSIKEMDCFSKRADIQSVIGYIPGEITFMNDMTGMEFIKFIANYRGLKSLDKAYELMAMFDLDPNGKIKKMSKGMKQKLGIIVAFMHDPEIYILDEPTSGLDPLMQNRFIELIQKEKARGKTILMSSHMFEEVEKTCEKVSIIKNGKIVAIDTIENLKKKTSKKYTIEFNKKKEINDFEKEKLNIIDIQDNRVTVTIKDNIKEFIKILTKYDIADIDEEHQSLEEVFLNYYGGEKND